MIRLERIKIWSRLPGGKSRGIWPERTLRITVSCELHSQGGKSSSGPRSHGLGISPMGLGRKGGVQGGSYEPLCTHCRKGSKDEGGRKVGDSKWVTAGKPDTVSVVQRSPADPSCSSCLPVGSRASQAPCAATAGSPSMSSPHLARHMPEPRRCQCRCPQQSPILPMPSVWPPHSQPGSL